MGPREPENLPMRMCLSRDVLTMSISLIGTIDKTCIEILTLHGGPRKTEKISYLGKKYF